jgi:hypothetical protein
MELESLRKHEGNTGIQRGQKYRCAKEGARKIGGSCETILLPTTHGHKVDRNTDQNSPQYTHSRPAT